MTSATGRLAVVVLLAASCAKEAAPTMPTKTDPTGSPEAAYRQFMLANLEGTEAKIRPLVVDQPGVEVLWQGAYPPEVAKMLAAQYRSMDIVRVVETPQKVTLKSTAAPTTLDLVFDGKSWLLDPAPIIAFRKKAAAQRAP